MYICSVIPLSLDGLILDTISEIGDAYNAYCTGQYHKTQNNLPGYTKKFLQLVDGPNICSQHEPGLPLWTKWQRPTNRMGMIICNGSIEFDLLQKLIRHAFQIHLFQGVISFEWITIYDQVDQCVGLNGVHGGVTAITRAGIVTKLTNELIKPTIDEVMRLLAQQTTNDIIKGVSDDD